MANREQGWGETIRKLVLQGYLRASVYAFPGLIRHLAAARVFSLLLAAALLFPAPSHAVDLKQCVSKLYSCGKNAALTGYYSVEAAAHILEYAVDSADCIASMTSGSPMVIGVTGMVVGLGAGGIVNPHSCQSDIYGAAAFPLAAGIDAVLPGFSLTSQLNAVGKDKVGALAQQLVNQIPVPSPAVPPTAGRLVTCGCNALEAGAQAIEDVKKVASFADATYASCEGAVSACPGLKQALTVIKGVIQVFSDPSSIVQSCDSMSRRQYVDARLMDMIRPTVEQFVANVPWAGSNMAVNHWAPRQKACYNYYDSHCYKEDDAKAFCNGAVWVENFDPDVWAAIIAEFNGPVFDQYFKDNYFKEVPSGKCPELPPGSVSLNPNAVANNAYSARAANASACRAEMTAMLNGTDTQKSFKALTRDLLPTSREGWNEMRLAVNDKPMIGASKIYRRAMTAAAVVIKARMAQATEKYMAVDAQMLNSAEFAAIPYEVLNPKYAAWAGFANTNVSKCPADPQGWNNKYDLQCVQEFLQSLGYSANVAYTTKGSAEFPPMNIGASVTANDFKFTTYYARAAEIMMPNRVPRIRIPGSTTPPVTQDEEYAFYSKLWPDASKAITAMLQADMPAFFTRQQERVSAGKVIRQQQDTTLAALANDNKIEGAYALSVCDQLKGQASPFMLCGGKIADITSKELVQFNNSRTAAGLTSPDKPAPDAAMTKAVTAIKSEHEKSLKTYAAVHKEYGIDPLRKVILDFKSAQKLVATSANIGTEKPPADPAAAAALDKQRDTLMALGGGFNSDSQRAASACSVAVAAAKGPCGAAVKKIADTENAAFKARALELFGKPPAEKAAKDADLNNLVRLLGTAHQKTIADYKDVLAQYSVSIDFPSIGGDSRTGAGAASGRAAVAIGSNPGGGPIVQGDTTLKSGIVPGAAAAIAGAGNPAQAGGPPQIGNTPLGVPGANAALQKLPGAPTGLPPPSAAAQTGRIGMQSAPTMGALPVMPKAGTLPGAVPPAFGLGAAANRTGAAAVEASGKPVETPKDLKISDAAAASAAGKVGPAAGGESPQKPPLVAMPPAGNAPSGVDLSKKPPPQGAIPGVAAQPPFDAGAFKAEREKALGDEWLPQCKGNGPCRQGMTVLIGQRVTGEVQSLVSGSPDYKNKVAVAAFIDTVDKKFDPQFEALIPKPAFVAAPPPGGNVDVIPNTSKIPPKVGNKIPGLGK